MRVTGSIEYESFYKAVQCLEVTNEGSITSL